MSKQFHEHQEIRTIPAREIARHPTYQRKSPLTRFEKKLGKYDHARNVEFVHVVKAPNGGFYAVNGATRVEACKKNSQFGPDTELTCKLYGNGIPPSGEQLAQLFLLLNTKNIRVGSETEFEQSVNAKEPDAVSAARLVERLGPNFKSPVGVWRLVATYGEKATAQAVEFALSTWGSKKYLHGQILKAIVICFVDSAKTKTLQSRQKTLRRSDPEHWKLRAQQRQLQQVGRREDITTWTVRTLLGKRSA